MRPEERRLILLAGDFLVACLSLAIALAAWGQRDWLDLSGELLRQRVQSWFFFLPLVWLVLMVETYDIRRASRRDETLKGILLAAGVSLVLYLLVFDLLGYLLHRAQHQWDWWWRLHAVHHSQRQMTMWSDSRNHLLDSVITDAVFVVVAILIGVAPSQFVWLVALSQLLENLQHANLRCSFGRLGERLLVSPRFHRRHHAIGIGHEAGAQGALKGVNFGVLFPFWDALLGSADFGGRFEPTGIRDQVEQGRDYGRGFWAQQWLGLRRLVGRA